MLVSDIMRTEFHTFNINDSLESVCEKMDQFKALWAPVVNDHGMICGIFTRPPSDKSFDSQARPQSTHTGSEDGNRW
jgi:predicted transcriptional regulator